MAKVFGLVNEKGGVGKTTTVANVCYWLAKEGNRVLGVDADGQSNLGFLLTGIEEHQSGIYDAMTNEDKNFDISKCLVKAKKEWGDMYVMPSAKHMHTLDKKIDDRIQRELILRNVLQDLDEFFDYIVIDMPPSVSLLTVNCFCAADYFILMSDTCKFSKQAFETMFKLAEKVKPLNPELKFAGVIVNMVQKENSLIVKKFLQSIKEEFGDAPLNCKIPHCVDVGKSIDASEPIYNVTKNKNFARKYKAVSDSIIHDL